ncbi:Hypothetical predicted protein [Mytilus galloprovincialis]|uniref:Uncharacterized protein n=1 Tax=Mytilus galloprovincialis TaxID=29158 RepID=A0A8B6BSF7_MYTGA|nr:Hypothetical predicted protein [Mytilus galloprovincialis]
MDREKKENAKIFQRKIYREKRSLKRKLQTKYCENNIRISLQTCSTIIENRQKLNGYMYEAQNSKFDFRSLLGLLAVLDHLECSTLIEFQDAFDIYSSFFEHQPDKNVFRDKILDVDKGLVCCYFMHPFDKVTYISLRTPDVQVERIIYQIFKSVPEKGEIIPTFSAETVEKILHSMDSEYDKQCAKALLVSANSTNRDLYSFGINPQTAKKHIERIKDITEECDNA